jgi:outer membrane protein W
MRASVISSKSTYPMTLKKQLLAIFAMTLLFTLTNAFAWEHEIAAGYGGGKEIEENYDNHAFLVSGKLYKFKKLDNTLIATIDSSITHIYAQADDHQNTTTFSVALALRAYFANPQLHTIRPYLGVSSGPNYLTSNQLGNRKQGANFDLRTTLEGGVEFGLKNNRGIDVNLQLIHYCNAGLAYPNQGFNVPLALSVGYQF